MWGAFTDVQADMLDVLRKAGVGVSVQYSLKARRTAMVLHRYGYAKVQFKSHPLLPARLSLIMLVAWTGKEAMFA